MPTVIALLAIIVVPVILYYTGIATSLTAGTGAVAALVILSRTEYLVHQDFPQKASSLRHRTTPTVLAVFIVGLIVAHAAIAWTYQPFNIPHFLASLAPLILVILAGCCVGQLLNDTADAVVDRTIRCCFMFFCVCALSSVLGFAPPSPRLTQKPVFPFNEPSHFAIIFTPFLIFCCIRARGLGRYATWIAGLAIAASLQNLTLVAGCGVAALAFVRGVAVLPVLLIALGAGTLVDLSYYVSRVDLAGDNPNLSVLTYLQGWQLVGESLSRSSGWGLGFQQLGLNGTDVEASLLIYSQLGVDENILDGAFNFAKVVSEFGVFGLILALVFLRLWWRSMRVLRGIASGVTRGSAEVFALSVIAGYLVELLVRGAGYFTGSGLLLVGALWIICARTRSVGEEALRASPVGGL